MALLVASFPAASLPSVQFLTVGRPRNEATVLVYNLVACVKHLN